MFSPMAEVEPQEGLLDRHDCINDMAQARDCLEIDMGGSAIDSDRAELQTINHWCVITTLLVGMAEAEVTPWRKQKESLERYVCV